MAVSTSVRVKDNKDRKMFFAAKKKQEKKNKVKKIKSYFFQSNKIKGIEVDD